MLGDRAVEVLNDLYTEAAWLGACVARSQIGDAMKAAALKVDWSGWKPGDIDAARLLVADLDSQGLRVLQEQAGFVMRGINATRMTDLSNALSFAVGEGLSQAATASLIKERLGGASRWANTVANTETRRAVTAASLDTYAAAGIEMKEWSTAGNAVDECKDFEDDGPIPLDGMWGDVSGPPAHPNCLCVVMPVFSQIGVESVPVESVQLSMTASLLKAGRNVIGDALDALDAIPAKDGKIPVPWPIGKRPVLDPEVWEDATIESVHIEGLKATQRTLNVETVRAYIKTPGAIEENRRAFANVYANSDGLMIVDGHHRLAALWLLGADHSNVWYLGE